jgi:hypothetical protein
MQHFFCGGKLEPLLSFSKTAQRKISPNGQKFAQSGHPGWHRRSFVGEEQKQSKSIEEL